MTIEQQNQDDDIRIKMFKALADPTRMDMIRMVRDKSDENGELPCSVVFETLPFSKSTVSFHFKTLREAGLTFTRKEARQTYFRLNRVAFDRYLPGLLDTF
ncbi:metalloregulator ArsR/SmtB family transcription factor [Lactococcus hircilactis]|uniref:Metalloregulator ArsR/SmtB family transcription factor n=1 Tax=Lactococcus hircilactis TaxID=1494462 RepID=A0A7X1ZAK6_9LACT|nr:metalloregulator ArsR/SmtB family transcription factor [Lactococcus hircilactis]MQW39796.1 metalloregulator ArsR/SmtB family transcription factor [Lactococcus hircilactis]